MRRVPEPELMSEEDQSLAYAAADFAEPHQSYVRVFEELFPDRRSDASVLDLGCGPCDVTIRFARANPGWTFVAVDGSPAMLRRAAEALKREPSVQRRVRLTEGLIPGVVLPESSYDVLLASSFLHHLHEPDMLWQSVKNYTRAGMIVFVPDLRRPESEVAAKSLVAQYASEEPESLRRDFYHSLLAAFTVEEVEDQLRATGLEDLSVRVMDDRHLLIWGRMV